MTSPIASSDESHQGETGSGPRQYVHAPEQVVLELPIAGPAARMLAYGIDYLLIVAIFMTVGVLLLLGGLSLDASSRAALASLDIESLSNVQEFFRSGLFIVMFTLLMIGQITIETLYFLFWEVAASGTSLGKRIVGLRVVSDQGTAITFSQSLTRNLMRIVDALPSGYLVGLVAMVMSSQGKRLGDLAGGTIVIRLDKHAPAPPVRDDPAPEDDAFRFDRDQAARIGPAELRLARQTMRRIDQPLDCDDRLSAARRESVLSQAVGALRSRLDHPAVPDAQRAAFLRAVLRAGRRGV